MYMCSSVFSLLRLSNVTAMEASSHLFHGSYQNLPSVNVQQDVHVSFPAFNFFSSVLYVLVFFFQLRHSSHQLSFLHQQHGINSEASNSPVVLSTQPNFLFHAIYTEVINCSDCNIFPSSYPREEYRGCCETKDFFLTIAARRDHQRSLLLRYYSFIVVVLIVALAVAIFVFVAVVTVVALSPAYCSNIYQSASVVFHFTYFYR